MNKDINRPNLVGDMEHELTAIGHIGDIEAYDPIISREVEAGSNCLEQWQLSVQHVLGNLLTVAEVFQLLSSFIHRLRH